MLYISAYCLKMLGKVKSRLAFVAKHYCVMFTACFRTVNMQHCDVSYVNYLHDAAVNFVSFCMSVEHSY